MHSIFLDLIFFFFIFYFGFSVGERIHDSPYEINMSIPVEGYDPIEFTLTKFCGLFFIIVEPRASFPQNHFFFVVVAME